VLHDTEDNKQFFGQLDLDTVRRDTAPTLTANCIIIDLFTAFEPGLVAPFLYAACKTAGFETKRPEI
jgi:hypothetical protein